MEKDFFFILNEKFIEDIKLEKNSMVQIIESIEYEKTFISMSFMNNKLWNGFIVHLDLCVSMFSK
jgi:hypothetical protein